MTNDVGLIEIFLDEGLVSIGPRVEEGQGNGILKFVTFWVFS